MASVTLLEAEAPPAGHEDLDNANLFEIIDGQQMEMPPMSAYSSIVGFLLGVELSLFGRTHATGRAVTEVLFSLPINGSRNRRPDAAFVSFQRWAADRPIPLTGNAWDVVPNLAVEVVSPHDLVEGLMEKIQEYFHAGVELVWVIYPQQRIVHVYQSFTSIQVRTATDDLDGGAVLPGFRLIVASLFPQAAP